MVVFCYKTFVHEFVLSIGKGQRAIQYRSDHVDRAFARIRAIPDPRLVIETQDVASRTGFGSNFLTSNTSAGYGDAGGHRQFHADVA